MLTMAANWKRPDKSDLAISEPTATIATGPDTPSAVFEKLVNICWRPAQWTHDQVFMHSMAAACKQQQAGMHHKPYLSSLVGLLFCILENNLKLCDVFLSSVLLHKGSNIDAKCSTSVGILVAARVQEARYTGACIKVYIGLSR